MNNKGRNNSTKSKKKVRKRKINKFRLFIVIIVGLLMVFGVFKVSTSVINMIAKKQVVNQEQDVDSENTTQDKTKDVFTILIDPGHGGEDGGTIGHSTKVQEKELVLDISKKVVSELSKYEDVEVMLTRTTDQYIQLSERVKYANSQGADVMASIHLNSEAAGNTGNGLETYYKEENSKKFAETIQNTVLTYIDVKDRGIKQANYETLKHSKIPTVVIECGFLSNPAEEKKLMDPKYQAELAKGIAQGILSYIETLKK